MTATAAPAATRRARVLIVDDDPIVAESLAEFLRGEGFDVASCFDAQEAMAALREAEHAPEGANRRAGPFNILITDMSMPGANGLDLVRHAAREHPSVVPFVITGYGTIESAVTAIRAGAFDYLSKPIVDEELRLTLERALRQQTLLAENDSLRRKLDERFGLGAIIGRDYRMTKAFEMIEAVAPSKATVLMTGESGTGKTVVARAIHQLSPRRDGPFVEIHCGSIPETLLESELFGHVRGAFTGAHADKSGKFLAADGGTIFIDEINSASAPMQLKLLRVLQERRFEPIGSNETTEVDVRVILATNQALEELVARGTFRQDLYYRINVVRIELPPLRDRAGDIPMLVEAFVDRLAAEHEKRVVGVTPEAVEMLCRYPFPGNVRELENLVERAVVLSRTPTIDVDDLPANVRAGDPSLPVGAGDDADGSRWRPRPLAEALEDPERRIILRALRANDWNRQRTADDLEINRTTLYKKMKHLGIDAPSR